MATLALGAHGPAARNATRRTEVGQFIVIKSIMGNQPSQQLVVGVYDAVVDAKAVGEFVLDPSDLSRKAAHDDALTREAHEEANINLNIFKKMVITISDFTGVGGGVPPPPADPLVGTFFNVANFPVISSDGVVNGVFSGAIKVISQHTTDGNKFACQYDFQGAAVEVTCARAYILSAQAAAAPPPLHRDVSLSVLADLDGVISKATVHVLGRMPRTLALQALSAIEIVEVCSAAGLAKLDTTFARISSPSFIAVASSLVMSVDAIISKLDDVRGWPTDPQAIGAELKRISGGSNGIAGGAPPSRHPLAEAVKSLALTAQIFDDFLGRSVDVTIESSRHAAAVSTDFIRMGALEAHLRKAGCTVDLINKHANATSLSVDELMAAILFDFIPEDHRLPGRISGGGGDNSTASPSSNLKLTITQPDLTGSEEEKSSRLSLRDDADALAKDSAQIIKLDALHAIKDEPAKLFSHVHSLDDADGIKRLVSSQSDIEKALAGALITLAAPLALHPACRCPPAPLHEYKQCAASPLCLAHGLSTRLQLEVPQPPSSDGPSASAVAGSAQTTCNRACLPARDGIVGWPCHAPSAASRQQF